MEDSYFGMLHGELYSERQLLRFQVYFPAASPGPSTVQTDQIHYTNRPNTHLCLNHPSQPSTCSSTCVKKYLLCLSVPTLTNWKFGRDKFCWDFWKSQTNLSVECVRTLNVSIKKSTLVTYFIYLPCLLYICTELCADYSYRKCWDCTEDQSFKYWLSVIAHDVWVSIIIKLPLLRFSPTISILTFCS